MTTKEKKPTPSVKEGHLENTKSSRDTHNASFSTSEQAAHALSSLQSVLRGAHSGNSTVTDPADPDSLPDPTPSAHYAPLWGAVSRAAGVDAHSAAYVFLFGHARAVISAGVRSGMLGPYQAQAKLAGPALRRVIEGLVGEAEVQVQADLDGGDDDNDNDGDGWMAGIERSGQAVPVMDLWVGRHELLYSRIFNS